MSPPHLYVNIVLIRKEMHGDVVTRELMIVRNVNNNVLDNVPMMLHVPHPLKLVLAHIPDKDHVLAMMVAFMDVKPVYMKKQQLNQ